MFLTCSFIFKLAQYFQITNCHDTIYIKKYIYLIFKIRLILFEKKKILHYMNYF
jgi:hypothetical protein